MKFKRRFNSVYYKLIISYIALVILTAALAGFVSIAYFSHNYRREIEKINTKLLSNLAKTLDDNIIMEAEKICIDLSIEQIKNRDLLFFFDNPTDGNIYRISSLYNYLRNVVSSNSDMIDSMSVYYLENDLIISSQVGVAFLDTDDTKGNIELSWLREVNMEKEHINWVQVESMTSPVKHHLIAPGSIAVVLSYPITYEKSEINTKGYIVLGLNREILERAVSQSTPKELGEIFIVNRQGQIISGGPNSEVLDFLRDENSMLFKDLDGSSVETIGGRKFILSYKELSNPDWYLIDLTSIEQFRKKITDIINPLIYLSLGAIVLGIFVSNRVTYRIYNPLKVLTDNTAKFFSEDVESVFQNQDEYGMLHTVLDKLSSQVTHLETTLNKNMPFINYHLVNGLFNNKIKDRDELKERLRLSNVNVDKSYFCVFFIAIDKKEIDSFPIEKSQYIKYSLIDFINSLISDDTNTYTIELSDYTIASIVNFESCIEKVKMAATDAIEYLDSAFRIEAVASIGIVVDDIMKVHESFNTAKLTMKYRYYIVNQSILSANQLLHRENSSSQIGEELLDEYRRGLNLGSKEIVTKVLSDIAKEMEHGDYSWEHCQQTMSRLIFIYCNYVKALNYKRSDILERDIYEWFNDIENIVEFNAWLMKIVDMTFNYIEIQAATKNSEVVDDVKDYIVANLDGDLSLISAADHVDLTPNYLSKIFKDYTGDTFIEHVVRQRLARAEALIVTTEKTMAEIANEVGYSSASYLIRKFREAYGMTPTQYRSQYENAMIRSEKM